MRDQRCLWSAEATSVSLTSAGCFCPFLLSPYFDSSAFWMPWPPGLPLVSPIDLSGLLSGYTLLSTRAMVQGTSNVPKGLVYPLIPNYASSLRHLHLNKGQYHQPVDLLFLDLLHPTQHVLLFISKPYSNPSTSQHLCPAPNPYLHHHYLPCSSLPSTQSIPLSPLAATLC